MSIVVLIGGVIGALPLILLFIDYRKRKEIHIPFIYLAVFGFTIAMLPFLLKVFGLWLALMAPLDLFVVLGIRSMMRRS